MADGMMDSMYSEYSTGVRSVLYCIRRYMVCRTPPDANGGGMRGSRGTRRVGQAWVKAAADPYQGDPLPEPPLRAPKRSSTHRARGEQSHDAPARLARGRVTFVRCESRCPTARRTGGASTMKR